MERVRQKHPLIHTITNPVTINGCANILLAAGAAPVMADCPLEAEEIQRNCDGLVLNLGMFQPERGKAMETAVRAAGEKNHPVVLDPVGAGASSLRREEACRLLESGNIRVIRGNEAEIRCLLEGRQGQAGVDAGDGSGSLLQKTDHAGALARRWNCVVAMTGETDVITDGTEGYICRNGTSLLSRLTGTGCMLSALTGGIAASVPERPLEAAALAVALMGTAGEYAGQFLKEKGLGLGFLQNAILDFMGGLEKPGWQEEIKLERM